MENSTNRMRGIIFASITAFFWGFLAIALKVATGILDPLTIVWFRFLVAFLVLFSYFLITKPGYIKILKSPPFFLIIASLGIGINYLGFLYGLKLTTPGTSQIIIQLGPVMLGMVGLLFFKEAISIRQGIGFIIVAAGMYLFYRETINQIVGNNDLFNMGILWILVAAMAWVVYAAFQKILVKSYPAQQLNLFLFGFPVLIFIPFINLEGLLSLNFNNWILLVFLGLNTLIAYGSLAIAFKNLEANKVSVIITMNPIITFGFMALLAVWEVSWIEPEILSPNRMMAAVLVLIGAILAVAFTPDKKKKQIDELIKIKSKST